MNLIYYFAWRHPHLYSPGPSPSAKCKKYFEKVLIYAFMDVGDTISIFSILIFQKERQRRYSTLKFSRKVWVKEIYRMGEERSKHHVASRT